MFNPYHSLSNCSRLESKMRNLHEAGNVPIEIYNSYRHYHFALLYKLKCSQFYVDTLSLTLRTTSIETINENFLDTINRNIDGFFYSLGSGLDILAREVLSYYDIPLPPRVYFHKAHDLLIINRPTDLITQKVQIPVWKQEFSEYRNTLTHERLIANQYNIEVCEIAGERTQKIIFPLPDDPRINVDERTYLRNRDVTEYTKDIFRKSLRLCNVIYKTITDDMTRIGRLPL